MPGKNILVERKDEIGFITLNRPEKSNTFNVPFAKELNGALWELEREDNIRVIIIKAAGKHFSTGIALDEFKDKNASEYREFIHLMDEHNHTIAKKDFGVNSIRRYYFCRRSGKVRFSKPRSSLRRT
jgi:enoyl-CoA hydratase/carnithine racemase